MTLICLISGQLAPNLFSVIHLKPTQVILIHTLDTYREALHFKDILSQRYGIQHIQLKETKPFNPNQIIQDADELRRELCGQKTILNYTAGTKPMAIQFVRVFEETDAKLLYVDTQQECFWWSQGDNTYSEPFDFHFGLPTLFDLENVSIRAQEDKNTIADLASLTNLLFNARKQDSNNQFRAFIKNAVSVRVNNHSLYQWNPSIRYKQVQIQPKHDNPEALMVRWNEEPFEYKNKAFWLTYFTGGWFEQWTYTVLDQLGIYDDVRCNLTIWPNQTEDTDKIKSEIDVAAICNTIPVFLECKTGRVNQKSVTNLKSMVDKYGPRYSEGAIVSFYPVTDAVIREKIEDYGLLLIEGPENLKSQLHTIHEEILIKK